MTARLRTHLAPTSSIPVNLIPTVLSHLHPLVLRYNCHDRRDDFEAGVSLMKYQ